MLRDTLKVTGDSALRLDAAAAAAIFYVNASDPMKGGTGHTLRACRAHQVLAAAQGA